MLSKVIWYETPVPVTLDTVSTILSEYINTTITSSVTKYGDIQKLNGSAVPAESSLLYHFSHPSNGVLNMHNYYNSMGSFVLANGTNGAVGGEVTSFAYPTPYLGINGFILYTSLLQDQAHGECLVASASKTAVMQGQEIQIDGLGSTTIILKSTYYSPIPGMALTGTDVASILQSFYQNVGMDTSSFSAFLQSNTALMSSFPMLASCLYQPYGFGPPAFKIPVSAMTATTTATTRFSGNPPSPGSPVKRPVPPQTTPPDTHTVPTTPPDMHPLNQPPEASKPLGQASSSAEPKQQPNLPSPAAPLQSPASVPSPPLQPTSPTYIPNILPPTVGPTTPVSAVQNNNAPSPAPVGSPPPQGQNPPNQAPPYSSPLSQDFHNPPNPQIQGPISQASSQTTPSQDQGSPNNIAPISPASRPQILTIGGSRYTADASTNFVIGGQTLTAGSPAITISGTPVSLTPGASIAVIGSSTRQLHQPPNVASQPQILTVGGSRYTADASTNFVMGGQTLAAGSPAITVLGTPVSLASGGSVAVIGSSTTQLHPPPILTFGSSPYTADASSNFIIGGQTLTAGSPAITVSGTPISLAPGGSIAVIGSSTTRYQADVPTKVPVLTLNGVTYTAISSSAFVIAGQTLVPGGSVTVSGTPITYPTAGAAVLIGSSTQSLSPVAISATPAPIFTFAGSTYTANPASGFVIGGQTLTEGGVVTLSGTPISYASNGGDVVVGTSTEALGSIIMNGFGAGPSSTGSNATVFAGGAKAQRKPSWTVAGAVVGTVVFVVVAGLS